MGAENDLRVKITAVDRASKVIEALQRKIGLISTPADRAGKSLRGIGTHTTDLERFARGKTIPTITRDFTRLSQQSFQAFLNVGRLSSEFRALSALAPTAGFLGALGGAAALTKTWADHGMRLRNTAANMGMTAGQLIRYQRVGAMAGVSSQVMTGSLQTLQQDAFKARFNGDPAALQVFRQLGIPLTDSHGNTVSPDAMMGRLASVLPGLNPMAQQFALQQLGLSGELMPFLRRGPGWIGGQMSALKAQGLTTASYDGSAALFEDFAKFDTAAIELSNALAKDFAPHADAMVKSLTDAMNWLKGSDKKVNSWLNWIDPSGKSNGFSMNPAENFGHAIRNRALGWFGMGPDSSSAISWKAMTGNARQSYDFWRSKGLSSAAALAMVGNEQGESGLNPHPVGGDGVGSFQWHAQRRADILKGTGIDVGSPRTTHQQMLQAAYWEMTQGSDAGARRAWSGLMGAKTIAGGIKAAVQDFERPLNPALDMWKRMGFAEDWSSTLGAPRALPGAAAAPSASGGGTVTVNLNHNNAPDGVSSSITSTGSAEIGTVRITKAMPTAMP